MIPLFGEDNCGKRYRGCMYIHKNARSRFLLLYFIVLYKSAYHINDVLDTCGLA